MIASAPAHGPEAVACVQAYVDELDERFPEGFDVSLTTSADAAELTPPHGDLLLVRDVDGNAVGVGCVKLLDGTPRDQPDGPTYVEIKRMWVAPSTRGHGVGTDLLERLEDRARELGATRAVLDSRALLGAVPLYEHNGYAPCRPFNTNPYPDWWGEKGL
jgi:GNAT superfamily N-acetyltransferase